MSKVAVKVGRLKLIETLKNKLVEMAEAKKAYEQAEAEHDKAHKAWEESVALLGLERFEKHGISDDSVSIRNWGYGKNKVTKVEISIEMDNNMLPEEPTKPKDPFEKRGYGREYIGDYDERVTAILNAVNILMLSDEEVVNTSTYSSITRYL